MTTLNIKITKKVVLAVVGLIAGGVVLYKKHKEAKAVVKADRSEEDQKIVDDRNQLRSAYILLRNQEDDRATARMALDEEYQGLVEQEKILLKGLAKKQVANFSGNGLSLSLGSDTSFITTELNSIRWAKSRVKARMERAVADERTAEQLKLISDYLANEAKYRELVKREERETWKSMWKGVKALGKR